MLNKIRVFGSILGLLMVSSLSTAHAQLLKYENEEELVGAALMSPGSVRQVLQKLVSLCSTYSPSLQSFGERELKKWLANHQSYLKENASIRKMLIAMSSSMSPQQKQETKNLLSVVGPKLIESQFETIRISIQADGEPGSQASRCNAYIQSIADGEFDLRKNDPALSAFFDEKINARLAIRAIPAPEPSNDEPSVEQQILGRWRQTLLFRMDEKWSVTRQAVVGKSIAEFFPNGAWSLVSKKAHSSGTYRWIDETCIEQTILDSNLATQVGTKSIKCVRIVSGKLELTILKVKPEEDRVAPEDIFYDPELPSVSYSLVYSRETKNPP